MVSLRHLGGISVSDDNQSFCSGDFNREFANQYDEGWALSLYNHNLTYETQQGRTPLCTLEFDDEARAMLRAELPNVRAALELVRQDSRLGFHQECQANFFDVPALERKIRELKADLDGRRAGRGGR